MVRYLPLGNNRMLVSFDRDYRIVDFYYAHDQVENHSVGHPFRYGISVDGSFRWVGREIISSMDYLDDSMTTEVNLSLPSLSVSNNDFVDIYDDVFAKRITLKNTGNQPLEVKLFFHQDFYIYGNDIGDTAYYEPSLNSVIHYKHKRFFLTSTIDQYGDTMDQYAVGIKGFGGFEGTWRDAEDSKLSFNPVAIGSVDSVIGHSLLLHPGESKQLFYFILAQESLDSIFSLRRKLSFSVLSEMYKRTRNYWSVWSEKKEIPDAQDLASLFRKSQFIIKAHMNSKGAIMASSDSDILKQSRDGYYYVWPRDAAIAAYALTRTYHFSSARKFFRFALSTISEGGYFHHKYHPDGYVASTWLPRVVDGKPILPIQEDETALVIWSMWQYYLRSLDVEYFHVLYEKVIKKAADFMSSFVNENGLPKETYDLWEERYGVHTFTIATVYAALVAASNFARVFKDDELAERYLEAAHKMASAYDSAFYSPKKGYYARAIIKGEPDFTVDSQSLALVLFGMKDPLDPRVKATVEAIMDRLWVKGQGGLARYEGDMYQRVKEDKSVPGNPWIITTLWASRYYIAAGECEKALSLIRWVLAHKQGSGVLPEQVNPYDGSPVSVSPLVWSHAEYVISVDELYEAKSKGQCRNA